MWRYFRDPTFSRFDTIPECDRHTDTHTQRHTTTAYTALSIASRGKNDRPIVAYARNITLAWFLVFLSYPILFL